MHGQQDIKVIDCLVLSQCCDSRRARASQSESKYK